MLYSAVVCRSCACQVMTVSTPGHLISDCKSLYIVSKHVTTCRYFNCKANGVSLQGRGEWMPSNGDSGCPVMGRVDAYPVMGRVDVQ